MNKKMIDARISCIVVPMSQDRPRMKVPALGAKRPASACCNLGSREGKCSPRNHRVETGVEETRLDEDRHDVPHRHENVVEPTGDDFECQRCPTACAGQRARSPTRRRTCRQPSRCRACCAREPDARGGSRGTPSRPRRASRRRSNRGQRWQRPAGVLAVSEGGSAQRERRRRTRSASSRERKHLEMSARTIPSRY